MDVFPEINAAIDIYADDATQRTIDGNIIAIDSSDDFLKEELESLCKKIELDKIICGYSS